MNLLLSGVSLHFTHFTFCLLHSCGKVQDSSLFSTSLSVKNKKRIYHFFQLVLSGDRSDRNPLCSLHFLKSQKQYFHSPIPTYFQAIRDKQFHFLHFTVFRVTKILPHTYFPLFTSDKSHIFPLRSLHFFSSQENLSVKLFSPFYE